MHQKFAISLTICLQLAFCEKILQPIVIVPHVKIFFGPPSPSTSKFPPIIELLVQRIQSQFSSYVYEDLSRPPTYEKPVYTLSPEEQATATEPLLLATEASTAKIGLAEEDEENVRPVEYGTLVVYLKRNSTVKANVKDDSVIVESGGEKGSSVLTALLNVKVVIPGNIESSKSNQTIP